MILGKSQGVEAFASQISRSRWAELCAGEIDLYVSATDRGLLRRLPGAAFIHQPARY